MVKTLSRIAFLGTIIGLLYAQGPPVKWVRTYNGPGNGDDSPIGVFVDSIRNVYIVGTDKGSNTGADVCLIKYDSTGQQLWVSRYNSSGNREDLATTSAMDKNGNIYIVGISRIGELFKSEDLLLLKYNTSGQQLWVRTYNGGDQDFYYRIELDDTGNVYVSGISYTSSNSSVIRIIKYKPNGDRNWIRTYNLPAGYGTIWNSYFHLTKNGEIYLAVGSEHSTRHDDWVIAKLSPQGQVLWEKKYKDPGNKTEIFQRSSIDDRGNIYLTGHIINEAGNDDFCTMKLDSLGNILWISQYNSPDSMRDEAYDLSIDNNGNLYVVGQSQHLYLLGHVWAIRIIKYDSTGGERWVKRYAHPKGSCKLSSIRTDEDGNLYVVGTRNPLDTMSFATVIKYDSSGNQVFVASYKPTGENNYAEGLGLEFDNQNNMYLVGVSGTAGVNEDILLIKYQGR